MKRIPAWSLVFLGSLGLLSSLSGCAWVSTTKVSNPDDEPNGIRVYPPRVYFLVDTDQKRTTVLTLPDFRRGYDVRPITIFAKQDFRLELEEGQPTVLESNNDTTAFLTFIKDAAEFAAKAAGGMAMSQQTVAGTGGLPSGWYSLDDNGNLVLVPKP